MSGLGRFGRVHFIRPLKLQIFFRLLPNEVLRFYAIVVVLRCDI